MRVSWGGWGPRRWDALFQVLISTLGNMMFMVRAVACSAAPGVVLAHLGLGRWAALCSRSAQQAWVGFGGMMGAGDGREDGQGRGREWGGREGGSEAGSRRRGWKSGARLDFEIWAGFAGGLSVVEAVVVRNSVRRCRVESRYGEVIDAGLLRAAMTRTRSEFLHVVFPLPLEGCGRERSPCLWRCGGAQGGFQHRVVPLWLPPTKKQTQAPRRTCSDPASWPPRLSRSPGIPCRVRIPQLPRAQRTPYRRSPTPLEPRGILRRRHGRLLAGEPCCGRAQGGM